MDIVERRTQSPAFPVWFVAVALVLLVAAMLLWTTTHRAVGAPAGASAVASTVTGFGPDAQDRNAQIVAARLGKAEATHGH